MIRACGFVLLGWSVLEHVSGPHVLAHVRSSWWFMNYPAEVSSNGKAASACNSDTIMAFETCDRLNGRNPQRVFFMVLADCMGAWYRFPATQNFELLEVVAREVLL